MEVTIFVLADKMTENKLSMQEELKTLGSAFYADIW